MGQDEQSNDNVTSTTPNPQKPAEEEAVNQHFPLMPNDDELFGIYNRLKEDWPSDLSQYLPRFEEVKLADKYYREAINQQFQYDKCHRPRLVVLAESPARTDGKIFSDPILPEYQNLVENDITDYHHFGHMNLVHCLSYGEDWLLSQQKDKTRTKLNRGTPIFWKVLSCLAGEQDSATDNDTEITKLTVENWKNAFAHLRTTNREKRIQNKKRILLKLKERSILLLDMSPLPIYLGSPRVIKENKKTKHKYSTPLHSFPARIKRLLKLLAWQLYCRPLLEKCCPQAFLVLGQEAGIHLDSELCDLARSIGSRYLGYTPHPSYRKLAGSNILPLFRRLCVVGRRGTLPPPPPEEQPPKPTIPDKPLIPDQTESTPTITTNKPEQPSHSPPVLEQPPFAPIPDETVSSPTVTGCPELYIPPPVLEQPSIPDQSIITPTITTYPVPYISPPVLEQPLFTPIPYQSVCSPIPPVLTPISEPYILPPILEQPFTPIPYQPVNTPGFTPISEQRPNTTITEHPTFPSISDQPVYQTYSNRPEFALCSNQPAFKSYFHQPAFKTYSDQPAFKSYSDKPAFKSYSDKPAYKSYS